MPKAYSIALILVALALLSACRALPEPSDVTGHALCAHLGTRNACRPGVARNIPDRAANTGFWDTTRTFPSVLVDGVGTIVAADKTSGLRRISHINACLPPGAYPIPAWHESPGEHDIEGTTLTLRRDTFAQLVNPEHLGPRFNDIVLVRMRVRSVGIETLTRAQLDIAARLAEQNPECRILPAPSHYVITSVLALENIHYTFHSASGQIRVNAHNLHEFFTPRDTESYSSAPNGHLIAHGRIYVAIQKAVALRFTDMPSVPAHTLIETLTAYCSATGC